jgi:putative peptide zinc metalloprotease protein
MTALVGGAGDDVQTQVLSAPATTRPAPAADVPVLAPGVELLGRQPGSGYVVPPALVRRGDGQVLQLTPLIYAVLEAIDGMRDVEHVARAASAACDRTLEPDDVRTLLDGRLRPLGLVLRPDGTSAQVAKASPLLALRPRFVISKPAWTRRVTAPFALLFNPLLVVTVTVAFAAVAYWVLFEKGLASAAYEAFAQPGLLLAVFVITLVSAGFHEFGHAAALRRGGGTPGAMGAGLYLIWPAFYTDVTDSYRLGRGARIRVDLGGLYFNAIASLVMFGVWEAVHWDGLLLVVAAQILQMIRQLPPLVRFDGYHLLADVTGVPDLFHRIGPTLRGFLPRRWRHPQSRALRPWVRVVVTTWVLLVVPLLLASAAVTVVAMPRILGTTGHSIAAQWRMLSAHAHHGDAAGAAVKALAIVALVIPVGGMVYMFVRAGRSYASRVWRATRGKPTQRGVAAVVAAAMVAGLAFAWWPHGNYRPIQPYERGTVTDVLPATFTPGLRAGVQRTATTIWADTGTALPTADRPALAVVLSPRSGTGPTWVFPFNRPDGPGPGDNQAMAIVTHEGGVAYDVAFALVWADGNTVLNRNEAYALASCKFCRAVAVGFQVVLVVGQAHVVAPQNIAAAVSYHCFVCVTEALAAQLVVTVPHPLSAAARRQLALLWAQIAAFQQHVRWLTFAQLQARIASYERQILAIVRPDLTASPAATPSATASIATATGGTSSTAPATAPSSTTSTAPAAGTADGSTSPAPSPSGSDPSASTSPTPTASPSPTGT